MERFIYIYIHNIYIYIFYNMTCEMWHVTFGTNQRGGEGSWIHVIILKFLALWCSQKNIFCRGHLVVPGHKCWRQSKNVVYISWAHLDPQVEAFRVGVLPGNYDFKVAFRLIFTFSYFVTNFLCVDICIALDFLF